MELSRIIMFALLLMAVDASNDAIPSEVYWKSKLPHTPLPKALQERLQPFGSNSSLINVSLSDKPQEGSRGGYYVGSWAGTEQKFDKNLMKYLTNTFFTYNNLIPNKRMKHVFTKKENTTIFLPHELSKSIPFSSHKLKEIFHYFSIKPTSKDAQIVKRTIKECEAPSIKYEDKLCATSFESLVDFVVTKFGNNVQILTNEVEEEKNKEEEYTILEGIKMVSENQIVCHTQAYMYAVFYCHITGSTKVYMVPMVGADGSKVKAPVVCHFDTSGWSPKHVAFQALHVQPGGPPICHYLKNDGIVWIPN